MKRARASWFATMKSAHSSPAELLPRRTVTCIGFDWRTEVALKETLALLHGRTRDEWRYSEDLDSDVVVYEASNALAQAMLRRAAPERVLYPSSSADPAQPVLRPPFGASKLIQCLDAASERLGARRPQAAAQASLSQQLDLALQDPDNRAILLEAEDGQRGVLRPGSLRLSWSQPVSLDSIAALLAGAIHIRALRAEPPMAADISWREVNAEPLLWAIGIARSSGARLARLGEGQRFRLRRWPNFGVLGRRAADLRLCSLLTQQPLSPSELAAQAGLPQATVDAFLNACALSGLTQESQSPRAAVLPARGTDSALGGVFRRIRDALAVRA